MQDVLTDLQCLSRNPLAAAATVARFMEDEVLLTSYIKTECRTIMEYLQPLIQTYFSFLPFPLTNFKK